VIASPSPVLCMDSLRTHGIMNIAGMHSDSQKQKGKKGETKGRKTKNRKNISSSQRTQTQTRSTTTSSNQQEPSAMPRCHHPTRTTTATATVVRTTTHVMRREYSTNSHGKHGAQTTCKMQDAGRNPSLRVRLSSTTWPLVRGTGNMHRHTCGTPTVGVRPLLLAACPRGASLQCS
jgi:hypothetical protein